MLCGARPLAAQAPRPSADLRPVVTVGVIVPLSGDMAFAGAEVRNAMRLAQEEYEERGSGASYRFELLFEDNRLDGKRSVAAAKKLVEIDKADVVVTLWPPTALVVLPITEAQGVLHYTIAWDPGIAKGHKYLLSHQIMVDEMVRAFLSLLQEKQVRRLAFVRMEESGFNIGVKLVGSLAGRYEIAMVSDQAYTAGEKDFKTMIAKAEAQKPDGYLVWGVMPEIELVLRQLRERRVKGYVTGYFDCVQDDSLIEGGEYASEMYSNSAFAERYRARFKKAPVSKGANAYDIMHLLQQAFTQFPDRKPGAAQVKEYLTGVRGYDGAVGRVDIDQFGNSSYPPLIRRVHNGARVMVRFAAGRSGP